MLYAAFWTDTFYRKTVAMIASVRINAILFFLQRVAIAGYAHFHISP
jgi:hypothetical protein